MATEQEIRGVELRIAQGSSESREASIRRGADGPLQVSATHDGTGRSFTVLSPAKDMGDLGSTSHKRRSDNLVSTSGLSLRHQTNAKQ